VEGIVTAAVAAGATISWCVPGTLLCFKRASSSGSPGVGIYESMSMLLKNVFKAGVDRRQLARDRAGRQSIDD